MIELYWPHTLVYPTTGAVLRQNQAGGQAAIVTPILRFRDQAGAGARALPETVRHDNSWASLVDRVEETLAEWPIPRLQRPCTSFLYEFGWRWEEAGGWSLRAYRSGPRAIVLYHGVGDALTSLGPLLRPFITRWWTDQAAQLNPDVEAARSVLEFEDFLFGRDRITLERIGEGLLDRQHGDCFYCNTRLGTRREIDHFIPWSHSGDDGIDNLVAACQRCNNGKRAALPGPTHVAHLLERNRSGTPTWARSHKNDGGPATTIDPCGSHARPTCAPQTSARYGSTPPRATDTTRSELTAPNSRTCCADIGAVGPACMGMPSCVRRSPFHPVSFWLLAGWPLRSATRGRRCWYWRSESKNTWLSATSTHRDADANRTGA